MHESIDAVHHGGPVGRLLCQLVPDEVGQTEAKTGASSRRPPGCCGLLLLLLLAPWQQQEEVVCSHPPKRYLIAVPEELRGEQATLHDAQLARFEGCTQVASTATEKKRRDGGVRFIVLVRGAT